MRQIRIDFDKHFRKIDTKLKSFARIESAWVFSVGRFFLIMRISKISLKLSSAFKKTILKFS